MPEPVTFQRGMTTTRKPVLTVSRHFDALVQWSDDAIVSKDLNGVIQSWNRAAERMFGFTADEAIGQSIRIIIPADRQREEDEVLGRIRRGETVDHFETVRRRKDGGEIFISLTVSPIRGAHGEILGASKIARDITDRKRIEAERDELLAREQEARREAERANRLKDEFLALVSHELRTPIHAIAGWAQIARMPDVTSADKERALEVIERNVRAQVRLIDDLLDAARIATGKLQIASSRVNLGRAAQDAIESVRPAADAKQITLESDLDLHDCVVVGDTARLQQVVGNLLSNAVKFTHEGGRISVALRREGSHATLEVRDSGRGISPAFLPHVFERFRQADTGCSGEYGGLGLGLAIVRHLVEAHGGSVVAASEGLGRGAVFTATIPLLSAQSRESR